MPAWQIHTVDSQSAATGYFPSLAILGGKPAISYFRSGAGLKYARATANVPSAPTDWVTMLAGATSSATVNNRLKAMPDGTPVITFTHSEGLFPYTHFYPTLARASSATPNSATDWTVYSVNTGAEADQEIDVTALPDGMPGPAYYDNNWPGYPRIVNTDLYPGDPAQPHRPRGGHLEPARRDQAGWIQDLPRHNLANWRVQPDEKRG